MNYAKITKNDIANGTGVRVVLWCSGCRLNCYNCHNQEAQNFCYGQHFTEESKKELFEALGHPWISGITFSGGHPLEPENIPEVYELSKEIRKKFPNKTIWLYTGYTLSLDDFESNTIMSQTLRLCDVVVDGPFIEKLYSIALLWRGSSNQRVIDVKRTLETNNIVLYC